MAVKRRRDLCTFALIPPAAKFKALATESITQDHETTLKVSALPTMADVKPAEIPPRHFFAIDDDGLSVHFDI